MAETLQGLLLQVIGGFYYVEAAGAVYECKARGLLRKEHVSPVAGDGVMIRPMDDLHGVLEEVLPRKNVLIRPPVANLDCLAVVASVAEPRPNLLLIDKMIALAEDKGMEPLLVVTKTDLNGEEFPQHTYRQAGIPVFAVTTENEASVLPLKEFLRGKVTAFTGNSGVGKSSLLNLLDPLLARETGEISQKLGRGKHTTRSAELIPLSGGGYLADTPGFSSLDTDRVLPIEKERVADCFREFDRYFGKCRFTGCSHIHEPDCAVRTAVGDGEVAQSRYDSYVAMYEAAEKHTAR